MVTAAVDQDLLSTWQNLIGRCSDEWALLVGLPAVTTPAIHADDDDEEDDEMEPEELKHQENEPEQVLE